jgi:hypothetical protein
MSSGIKLPDVGRVNWLAVKGREALEVRDMGMVITAD